MVLNGEEVWLGSGRRGVPIAYRGIFVCGACGCMITGEIKKGRYTYYHCTRRKGPCREAPLREETLEAQIAEQLQRLALDDEILALARDALADRGKEARDRRAAERLTLETRAAKLREFIDRSYEDKLEGRISPEFWDEKTKAWRTELARIERQLADAPSGEGDPAAVIRALELAKRLPETWLTRTKAHRREILEIVGSNSTVRDGSVVLKWRKPFDLIAERPSSEGWWR